MGVTRKGGRNIFLGLPSGILEEVSQSKPYTSLSFLHFLSLRHYATSRKVADSIPDEVIGFFN
jgi:hypothetical protein